MKQVTDQQIAAVMGRAKSYAKTVIKCDAEYDRTKGKRFLISADKYRNKLESLCMVLELLGIADCWGDVWSEMWEEAERELQDESHQ